MKDLILKTKIAAQVEYMQLPRQLIDSLENQQSAQEVQLILNALNELGEQWH